MKRTVIFKTTFNLFFTLFIDCGHIYAQNRDFQGYSNRPQVEDPAMHFFYFGVHPLSLGSAKNSPFWTQKIDSKRFRMIKQLFLDFLNDGFPKFSSRCQLYRELDGFSFSSTMFSMRVPPSYLAPSMP